MKKILICEDEKDFRELLKDRLSKEKHKLYTADDGKDAVEKAKEIKPDLILLDIRMPKLDGLEAAKEIRKFNKRTKIIFLTAFQSPELSKEASKYNIFDYIVKSVSSEEILKIINMALQ